MMKLMTPLLAIILSLGVAGQVHAAGGQKNMSDSAWAAKIASSTSTTGRSFEYKVAGYHIRIKFEGGDRIRWTRLAAPDGTTGQSEEQKIDRTDLHPGIFLMAWTEKDGSHVFDVVDLQQMKLYANFVFANGKRGQAEAILTEVN
ncbi:MAG: hypothetical protein ACI9XZ_002900 [Alphaproteobacteria bacterium]|jgi:hypothetical protein